MGKSEGPHTLLGTPNFSVRPRTNTLKALESREEWKYIRKLLSLEFSKRQFEDDNTMDDIRFVPSPFCLVLQTKPNTDVC